MSDLYHEIEQAKAEVEAARVALSNADRPFFDAAVYRLAWAEERLNALYAEAKREEVTV